MSDDAGRHALCGSWKLISFELRLPSGDLSYPFGRDAKGYVF